MSKKPVIVFEGVECSGKSYHISMVARYLKKKRVPYIRIREPGGSRNSEKIRKLILNKESSFNKNTDLLLYLAARSENLTILKKNYKKKIILIDRFTDSTVAYQHYGLGSNLKLILLINNYLLKNFSIDFTFLNIVNKNNMLKRLRSRKNLNRYDKFDYSFYKKVQNGYLKLAKKKKNRYQIINSNLEKNINKNLIIEKIKRML